MALPPPIDVPTPPFPSQDAGTAWPTTSWPVGPIPEGLDLESLLDRAVNPDGPCRTTNAVVVIHKGRLIAERYAGNREFFDREPEPIDANSSLISWSMAKSMLQVLTFSLIAEGVFQLDAPLQIPEWSATGDPRAAITLAELLAMRDGLAFIEDYVDGATSDVIEMLFGGGKADVAHFAAYRPLAHEPGMFYNYSSGTTNIISGAIARHFGSGEAYKDELRKRLFEPLGMLSADPGFDDAGTFIGSSYVHATAQDFARFGLCLLRGGVFNGQQVISPAALEAARTPLSRDPDGLLYSMQFWLPGDAYGTFAAQGYEGQSITVCPALDVVLVRLGRTPSERFQALLDWRWSVLDAFAALEK